MSEKIEWIVRVITAKRERYEYREPFYTRIVSTLRIWKDLSDIAVNGSEVGLLPGPLPRCCLIPTTISLVEVCNVRHKRIVGVGVGQHRADG